MSRLRGPWKLLGIEPTDDSRAIRRAYAAKLKAIDVDRDPQAFIKLREALDQAQNEARWRAQSQADDEESDEAEDAEETENWQEGGPGVDFNFDFDAFERDPLAAEVAMAPTVPSPWAPLTAEDYDDHARALATLLHEHAGQSPDADQTEAMLAHWQRIVRDPRMLEMSFYGDAENWFADLVARTSPFSDPLAAPVSDFFGWMQTAGEIRQAPAIAYVVRRRQSLAYFDAIRRPAHPLYAAYLVLTNSEHRKLRRGWVGGGKVRELLATVRAHYPELEDNFDPSVVALWEPTTEKRRWNWVGTIVVWILIALLHFATSQCQEKGSFLPSVQAPEIQLSNERVDTDRALERLYRGDLDIATIEDRNPELYVALLTHWKQAFLRKDTLPKFTEDLRLFLNQRLQADLATAALPLLREYQQLTLDRAKALRAVGPAICADFLNGRPYVTDKLPELLRDRSRALMARTLLETHPDPTPAPRSKIFTIPGVLVARAAKRAGMTPQQMGQALRFEGPQEQLCAGRIAFIETVLAEPDDEKIGTILRSM